MSNISTINNIPLIRQYPKPERECKGPKSILYRVHFLYKSRQTGDKYYNLVGGNFVFNTDNPNRKIKAGDLVKYKPRGDKGKEDPNYDQVARVTRITLKGEPVQQKTLIDIEFQNPKEVNNKVVNEKENVSKESLELLLQDNDVVSFVCQDSLIPKSLIREYELARNNFKNSQSKENGNQLSKAEDKLWNVHFELDDNNQPKYPLLSTIHNPPLINNLNKAVERMVKVGFVADSSDVKKKIIVRNGKKIARFPVPEGFKPGKNITINIDGHDIIVKIPIQINGQTPEVREMIEVEILQSDNNEIFHKLKSSSNNSGKKLEFIPTVILSDYSNFDKGAPVVLGKLVKPSENQKFHIRSAVIEKVGSNNFDFKKLDTFDKNIEHLVFDLEVKVLLELDVSDVLADGEKTTVAGNMGRSIKSAILSGNSLNCKENMRKLKEGTQEFIEKVMPAGMKLDRLNRKNQKEEAAKVRAGVVRSQKRILNNIQKRSSNRHDVRTASNASQLDNARERIEQRRSPRPSAPPLEQDPPSGGRRRHRGKRTRKKKKTRRKKRYQKKTTYKKKRRGRKRKTKKKRR